MAKRGRPRKKELVSKIRFAEMCGMNHNTLNHYMGGDDPRVITDAESGKIDLRNEKNDEFLRIQKVKINQKQALESADFETRTKIAELLKIESDAKWKASKARRDIGDLILKDMVEFGYAAIAKAIRELILPIGDRIAPEIAAIFETTDRKKILKARKKINDEHGRALEDIIKTIKEQVDNEDFRVTLDEQGVIDDI